MIDLPPNIDEIRKADPAYAAQLEAFALMVHETYGDEMARLHEEDVAIAELAQELDARRKRRTQDYQALRRRRVDANHHKFPKPPEKAQPPVVEGVR